MMPDARFQMPDSAETQIFAFRYQGAGVRIRYPVSLLSKTGQT
jgi:hypothetical protein